MPVVRGDLWRPTRPQVRVRMGHPVLGRYFLLGAGVVEEDGGEWGEGGEFVVAGGFG